MNYFQLHQFGKFVFAFFTSLPCKAVEFGLLINELPRLRSGQAIAIGLFKIQFMKRYLSTCLNIMKNFEKHSINQHIIFWSKDIRCFYLPDCLPS